MVILEIGAFFFCHAQQMIYQWWDGGHLTATRERMCQWLWSTPSGSCSKCTPCPRNWEAMNMLLAHVPLAATSGPPKVARTFLHCTADVAY